MRGGKKVIYRSCTCKVAYPTGDAAAHRAGLRALYGEDKLMVYKCRYAEHYHIAKWKCQHAQQKTSSKKRERKETSSCIRTSECFSHSSQVRVSRGKKLYFNDNF